MTSNLKTSNQTVIPNDSVQVNEQEILKHLADTLNFKFSLKTNKQQGKLDTLSQVNGMNGDDKSVMSYNSYKAGDSPLKMCQRIWSAYTKYIRQQCKKDKVVDSLFFGTFAKKESPQKDSEDTH